MGTRQVDVWHDASGKILAVGHAPGGGHPSLHTTPLAVPGQGIIREHVAEEHVAKLHETHRVDVQARALKPLT